MNHYLSLWFKMPREGWHTAKELDMAPATLTAMCKRDMVEATNTSPKTYRRKLSAATVLLYLLEKYKSILTDYIGIYKPGELGMLCRIKENAILDCYDRTYDITNAYKIRIGNRYFSLYDGKEII